MRAVLPYLAVILIAGAMPARAQTLPFYDKDEVVAKCIAQQNEKMAEEYARFKPETQRSMAKTACVLFGMDEQYAHDTLANNWNSYPPGKRQSCIALKSVTSYYELELCLKMACTPSDNCDFVNLSRRPTPRD